MNATTDTKKTEATENAAPEKATQATHETRAAFSVELTNQLMDYLNAKPHAEVRKLIDALTANVKMVSIPK